MRHRRPLLTVVLGACALGLALLLGLLALPRAEASGEDPGAARAVAALSSAPAHVAQDRLPPGFVPWAGYRPEVRDGLLVRPDGSCSSPVALPRRFRAACRQHDLGYDLIRYATARGAPLGRWARVRLDRTLRDQLRHECAGSDGTWCEVAASTAYTAVRANSLRQGDLAPSPETPASVGSLVVGATGLIAMAGGAGGLLRRLRSSPVLRGRRAAASWVARPPAAPVSVLVGLGIAASLTPSMLARPAWLQGVFTGLLASAGYLVGHRLSRHRVGPGTRTRVAGLVAAAVLVVAGAAATGAQPGPLLDPAHSSGLLGGWLQVVAIAAVVAVVAVGLARLAHRAWRGIAVRLLPGPARALAPRQRVYVGTTAAVVLVIVGGDALGTAGGAVLTSAPARHVVEAVGLPTAEENVLSRPSPRDAVRVYVGVTEASGAKGRAALAVRRLEARGGFDRDALVLAFPTGSGWVDPIGVTAVESRFDTDVATVAVQPTYLPSWAALLVAREEHERAARALLDAVAERMARMPARTRPDLYLLGQSLGVLAATGIDPDSPAAAMVCGASWAGPPGGEAPALGHSTVIANRDDPVVHWKPSLAWRRPASYPAPVWVPLVSYLATGVDTIASLSTPIGHGHRYGPEQGIALAGCAPGQRRTDLIWPPGV